MKKQLETIYNEQTEKAMEAMDEDLVINKEYALFLMSETYKKVWKYLFKEDQLCRIVSVWNGSETNPANVEKHIEEAFNKECYQLRKITRRISFYNLCVRFSEIINIAETLMQNADRLEEMEEEKRQKEQEQTEDKTKTTTASGNNEVTKHVFVSESTDRVTTTRQYPTDTDRVTIQYQTETDRETTTRQYPTETDRGTRSPYWTEIKDEDNNNEYTTRTGGTNITQETMTIREAFEKAQEEQVQGCEYDYYAEYVAETEKAKACERARIWGDLPKPESAWKQIKQKLERSAEDGNNMDSSDSDFRNLDKWTRCGDCCNF